jgi:hypothetical protein
MLRPKGVQLITLVVTLALVASAVSFFLWRNKSSPKTASKETRETATNPDLERKRRNGWCTYDNLPGAYAIDYPCSWTLVGRSTDETIYLSPNVQAGFGISINSGDTDAGLSHSQDLGKPRAPLIARIANISAQKTVIRWSSGPGAGRVAETIYTFEHGRLPYSVILHPSIDRNGEDLLEFGEVLAAFRLK